MRALAPPPVARRHAVPRAPAAALLLRRHLADDKKAAPKAKKKEEKKAPLPVALRHHKVGDKVPIAIFKDQPEPVIKPDAAYPAWLATVDKLPTLGELVRAREMRDPSAPLTPKIFEEERRYWRIIARQRIRDRNAREM